MTQLDFDLCRERESVLGSLQSPPSPSLALNFGEYRLASSLKFGLPIFPDWAENCNYGSTIDDSGYHVITCKLDGGPVWSHESIASLWSDFLRSLHIHHCREPRHRYANIKDRPDIVDFDTVRIYH